MRYDSLDDWLHWLESSHPWEIELGLDRITCVADRLGFAFAGLKVITVAGTNGKGSCVALISSLLSAAGYRTAAYTSPHILDFNERICVDGTAVSDSQIMQAFDHVEQALEGVSLTYFEFTTLAALDIFNRQQLDVMILEVGLGGRLDAVNIIDPDVAVITSIAIDHQEWLGDNRELIATEKAGIMRPGKPLVCGDSNPPESIGELVAARGAQLYQRNKDFSVVETGSGRWCWHGKAHNGQNRVLDNLPLPLLAIDNVATAIQAIELVGLDVNASVYNCIATISLQGRFQHLQYRGRQLILDVAHNPAAARQLSMALQQPGHRGQTCMLFALMQDKDAEGFIAELEPVIDKWFVVGLQHTPRAMAAADLAQYVSSGTGRMPIIYDDAVEGMRAAVEVMNEADRLVVSGSFFLVAAVMKEINLVVGLNE